jgi:hypothetical protein
MRREPPRPDLEEIAQRLQELGCLPHQVEKHLDALSAARHIKRHKSSKPQRRYVWSAVLESGVTPRIYLFRLLNVRLRFNFLHSITLANPWSGQLGKSGSRTEWRRVPHRVGATEKGDGQTIIYVGRTKRPLRRRMQATTSWRAIDPKVRPVAKGILGNHRRLCRCRRQNDRAISEVGREAALWQSVGTRVPVAIGFGRRPPTRGEGV